MSETIRVPLHLLSITSTNARRDHVADKAMIASLKSQGLLYPLLVKGIDGSESYDVIDGARRLSCILKGLEDGELDVAQFETVPCLINGVTGLGGLERSLHANLHQAMHPLDECEAILKLAEDEEDKAAIALRFGQDEKWLDQRVKLAGLADEVKEAFRAGSIGLGEAMDFTLGVPARQKAFLKHYLRDDLHRSAIRQEMMEKAVNAKYVNFDLRDYPENKIQRDLFSEEVFLLDRKKVAELQDDWAAATIAELKELGYDEVKALASDDWQTLQAHVEVEGEITPEARSKLKCFLKKDHYGYINVYQNYASRKAVEKAAVKKSKHSADSVEGEAAVKPLVCTELSPAQQEIVNALAASDLYTRIEEGDELLAQFMVIDRHIGQGFWTGSYPAFGSSSLKRWERLNKDYPAEQLITVERGRGDRPGRACQAHLPGLCSLAVDGAQAALSQGLCLAGHGTLRPAGPHGPYRRAGRPRLAGARLGLLQALPHRPADRLPQAQRRQGSGQDGQEEG